jgi:hypothetical protein
MKIFISAILLILFYLTPAFAHPEFQRYLKSVSGRTVNCAMCHMHSDGPIGLKPGQIGSLNQDELNDLGLARQANKSGSNVKNPILNQFGNSILNQLGKDKILELKQRPELLPESLSKTSDLDGDGIPDVEEIKDGTNPLNSLDGLPWKLFKINFVKSWFDILMLILATGFGLYGIQNALIWLSIKASKEK